MTAPLAGIVISLTIKKTLLIPRPLQMIYNIVFHLLLRLITYGGRSARLAYRVYKSGRKTSTFIF